MLSVFSFRVRFGSPVNNHVSLTGSIADTEDAIPGIEYSMAMVRDGRGGVPLPKQQLGPKRLQR
jgi:hypothetical protein